MCVYNGREKCLNPSPYETLLLLTLATRESADIEELVDDFVTFYAAGQETSSNLLCFALVLTLLHPNVLERYVKIAMSIVVNTVYSAWTNKCSCIYIWTCIGSNQKLIKFLAPKIMSVLKISKNLNTPNRCSTTTTYTCIHAWERICSCSITIYNIILSVEC